jgi:hypothetical protein
LRRVSGDSIPINVGSNATPIKASVKVVSAGPAAYADRPLSRFDRYLFPIDTRGRFCPNSTLREGAEATSGGWARGLAAGTRCRIVC